MTTAQRSTFLPITTRAVDSEAAVWQRMRPFSSRIVCDIVACILNISTRVVFLFDRFLSSAANRALLQHVFQYFHA
jgi:hypothetical protein